METFNDFATVKLINQAKLEGWQKEATRSARLKLRPAAGQRDVQPANGWRRTVGFWLMRCGMRLAGVAQ